MNVLRLTNQPPLPPLLPQTNSLEMGPPQKQHLDTKIKRWGKWKSAFSVFISDAVDRAASGSYSTSSKQGE